MIPKKGHTYKFFDDGKVTPSRMYDATVLYIVSKEQAKNITVDIPGYIETTSMSLVYAWKLDSDAEEAWSIFAKDTDYFIGCSIPNYDENIIWFARTKDNGWFSFNIQSAWQSGRLDVTGEIYKQMQIDWKEWYGRQV